jgi:zinc transporter ZupT
VALLVVQVPEGLALQALLVKVTVVGLQVLGSMTEPLVAVVVLAVQVATTLEAIRVVLVARGLLVISPVTHQPMVVAAAAEVSLEGRQLQAEAADHLT